MTGQLNLFDQEPEPEKFLDFGTQNLDAIDIRKDAPDVTLSDLVPEGALLALNRGYGIKSIHISSILNLLKEKNRLGIKKITRDEIGEELGIPWASMQGTMNVMRRVELIRPRNSLLPLGKILLDYNPHLTNPGFLWFFHYLLASNAELVLWSHIFNNVLGDIEETSVQEVTVAFRPLIGRWSEKTIVDKIPHEVGGIFRTYTETMLASLGLLFRVDTGAYEVYSNTANIPPLIWLSSILAYRERYYPNVPSLEVPLIVSANYSPGRIFRQSEATVRRALDKLHNLGMLTVETRSGLDQVRFKRETTWLSGLVEYFCNE